MFSIRSAFGYQDGQEYVSNETQRPLSDPLLTESEGKDQASIEKAFARVFSTKDGQLILSHLQSISFQRTLGPEASDMQLRYLEGQRAMIATIMRLIRSGRTPNHH